MTLPHDMSDVVEKYWDTINARVTYTLIEIGDPPVDGALDGIDPLLDMYGCGQWGCAYPTSQPRWAVKVSTDPTELDIIAAVLSKPELRENPGIAYILDIWRLSEVAVELARWGDEDREFVVHVTLRENITPIETDHATEHVDDLILLLHKLRVTSMQLNTALQELAEAEHSTQIEDPEPWKHDLALWTRDQKLAEYEKFEHLWLRLLQRLQNEHETAHLAWFISDFARDFNTALADIHAGNVGLREHSLSDLGLPQHEAYNTWVAFDLGHSLISTGAEVPLVANPPRIPMI